MKENKNTYQQPVIDLVRKDFTALNRNLTVDEALSKIRREGVGERIVYFYVVDDEEKLVGVLPTRRILTARPDQKIEDIMVKNVASIQKNATVYDACEFFVMYKFLAFPVVDEERKIIGIVDVNLFTDELLDFSERQKVSDVFESIGFQISKVKNATPLKAWQIRFPWLLATITSGTICAILAGMFEATLAESLVIAFFLTLVLGLGESMSIQSMTLTIQTLHSAQPSLKWYWKSFLKESQTALLIGGSSGLLVALIAFVWKGDVVTSVVIGTSILLVQLFAAVLGLSVPALLHSTELDLKVSAGPITLALTDIFTILFYMGIATIVL
ncbi:MAG: CBS domain-containing protein [Melioribacteraceae bacterium]|nr:CBS domain-containing protein [Melioribacteraceae bacterium]